MLKAKGVKAVKPPNDGGLDFDMGDDTRELISKGLITADLLTTPAPVCVRMCPDFSAATFAHGNCTTPAEIRRKFLKEKREDNLLAYFNLDEKMDEIQDGLQKILSQENWYVQYSDNCKAEFGSTGKKNSHHPTGDNSLKRSRKSIFTLSTEGSLPIQFRKPTIAVVRVSDEECRKLAAPAKKPQLNASFNAEYLKLNQEYLGLDSGATAETIALRVPGDEFLQVAEPAESPEKDAPISGKRPKLNLEHLESDNDGADYSIEPLPVILKQKNKKKLAAPAKKPQLNAPISDKCLKFNQEHLESDNDGTDYSIETLPVMMKQKNKKKKQLAAPAKKPQLSAPFNVEHLKLSQEYLGLDSGAAAKMITLCVKEDEHLPLADPAEKPQLNAPLNAKNLKLNKEYLGSDESIATLPVPDDEFIRLTGPAKKSSSVSDDDSGGGADMICCSDSVSDDDMGGDDCEEEMEVDLFADGTADDLFPDEDIVINKVRVRKFNK